MRIPNSYHYLEIGVMVVLQLKKEQLIVMIETLQMKRKKNIEGSIEDTANNNYSINENITKFINFIHIRKKLFKKRKMK